MLLPAPVEMPCREKYADGAACTRDASIADVLPASAEPATPSTGCSSLRGGERQGQRLARPCDRDITEPTDGPSRAARPHAPARRVHPDRGQPRHARARTVLDIPIWDFDNQGSQAAAEPVQLDDGDTLRVTCRHVQGNRDVLPAFDGMPDRYVRVGRGHHRRDVPRHRHGHPPLTWPAVGLQSVALAPPLVEEASLACPPVEEVALARPPVEEVALATVSKPWIPPAAIGRYRVGRVEPSRNMKRRPSPTRKAALQAHP